MTSERKNKMADTLEGAVCPVCHVGQLEEGRSTSTLERAGAVVVVKDVPGWVCTRCGESYHEEDTTQRLLSRADAAFKRGAEVEVLRWSRSPMRSGVQSATP